MSATTILKSDALAAEMFSRGAMGAIGGFLVSDLTVKQAAFLWDVARRDGQADSLPTTSHGNRYSNREASGTLHDQDGPWALWTLEFRSNGSGRIRVFPCIGKAAG